MDLTQCRTCSGEAQPQGSLLLPHHLMLRRWLYRQFQIEVSEDNSLPDRVCYNCLSHIRAWIQFSTSCRQTQQALHDKLAHLANHADTSSPCRTLAVRLENVEPADSQSITVKTEPASPQLSARCRSVRTSGDVDKREEFRRTMVYKQPAVKVCDGSPESARCKPLSQRLQKSAEAKIVTRQAAKRRKSPTKHGSLRKHSPNKLSLSSKQQIPSKEPEAPNKTEVTPSKSQKLAPNETEVTPSKSQKLAPNETEVNPSKSQKSTPNKSQKLAPNETEVNPGKSQKLTPNKSQKLSPNETEMNPGKSQKLTPNKSEKLAPNEQSTSEEKPSESQNLTAGKSQKSTPKPPPTETSGKSEKLAPNKQSTTEQKPSESQNLATGKSQKLIPNKSQKLAPNKQSTTEQEPSESQNLVTGKSRKLIPNKSEVIPSKSQKSTPKPPPETPSISQEENEPGPSTNLHKRTLKSPVSPDSQLRVQPKRDSKKQVDDITGSYYDVILQQLSDSESSQDVPLSKRTKTEPNVENVDGSVQDVSNEVTSTVQTLESSDDSVQVLQEVEKKKTEVPNAETAQVQTEDANPRKSKRNTKIPDYTEQKKKAGRPKKATEPKEKVTAKRGRNPKKQEGGIMQQNTVVQRPVDVLKTNISMPQNTVYVPNTVDISGNAVAMPPNTFTVPPKAVSMPQNTFTVPQNTFTVPPKAVSMPQNPVATTPCTAAVSKSTVALPKNTVMMPPSTVAPSDSAVAVPLSSVTVPGNTVAQADPSDSPNAAAKQAASPMKTKAELKFDPVVFRTQSAIQPKVNMSMNVVPTPGPRDVHPLVNFTMSTPNPARMLQPPENVSSSLITAKQTPVIVSPPIQSFTYVKTQFVNHQPTTTSFIPQSGSIVKPEPAPTPIQNDPMYYKKAWKNYEVTKPDCYTMDSSSNYQQQSSYNQTQYYPNVQYQYPSYTYPSYNVIPTPPQPAPTYYANSYPTQYVQYQPQPVYYQNPTQQQDYSQSNDSALNYSNNVRQQ